MKVIDFLEVLAVRTAQQSALELRIDRSALSEAVYLKVRREGEWRGIRLASHPPVYACSRDPVQVLVPLEAVSPDDITPFALRVVAEVLVGGRVIADPDEVDRTLEEARRLARDGAWRRGARHTYWQWSETEAAWRLTRIRARRPQAGDAERYADCRPTAPPVVRLSAEAESAVRHRLNVRACWSHEESQAHQEAGVRTDARHPIPSPYGVTISSNSIAGSLLQ